MTSDEQGLHDTLASSGRQCALPLPESQPRYWIARQCSHWSPEQNRRFRLYRLDGPTDHVGRYPGAVWDADRKQWLDQRCLGGIATYELLRPAAIKDLKGVDIGAQPTDR